jgi:hypothetical protein
MKNTLFMGLGEISFSLGLFKVVYWFVKTRTIPWKSLHFSFLLFFSFLLLFVSGVLITAAQALRFGKESGAWKEIYERSTVWEMTTGRVPTLKHETIPPPVRSSRDGLIIALIPILPAILVIPIYILATFSTAALCSVAVIILSILFFGFFMNRSKK